MTRVDKNQFDLIFIKHRRIYNSYPGKLSCLQSSMFVQVIDALIIKILKKYVEDEVKYYFLINYLQYFDDFLL